MADSHIVEGSIGDRGPGVPRILAQINGTLNGIAGVFILAIMVATLIGVVTRYVLRDPATWPYPVSSYLLLWVIYMATSKALQNGEHVRVDFILNVLPGSVRFLLEILSRGLTSLFLAVFFWQVSRLFWRSWVQNTHDTSTIHAPLAWMQIIMPAGLLLIFLTSIAQLVQQFRRQESANT